MLQPPGCTTPSCTGVHCIQEMGRGMEEEQLNRTVAKSERPLTAAAAGRAWVQLPPTACSHHPRQLQGITMCVSRPALEAGGSRAAAETPHSGRYGAPMRPAHPRVRWVDAEACKGGAGRRWRGRGLLGPASLARSSGWSTLAALLVAGRHLQAGSVAGQADTLSRAWENPAGRGSSADRAFLTIRRSLQGSGGASKPANHGRPVVQVRLVPLPACSPCCAGTGPIYGPERSRPGPLLSLVGRGSGSPAGGGGRADGRCVSNFAGAPVPMQLVARHGASYCTHGRCHVHCCPRRCRPARLGANRRSPVLSAAASLRPAGVGS